ncbi:MAG: inorganic diphosphatase [bacterium]|nr:inorganic diphosphatase [bacterium]
MSIHNVKIGDKAPDVVNVIIEIPAGCKNKYEFDEETGAIFLDRVNHTAMAHPYDYGFIPDTRSEDNDHLDAFVINDYSVFSGCVVPARPVGIIYMIDDSKKDEKIICVPNRDSRYDHVKDLADLNQHISKEIQYFLEHYKDLQNKKCEVTGWGGRLEALRAIKESKE